MSEENQQKKLFETLDKQGVKIVSVKTKFIKGNPLNPRVMRDDNFQRLVQSVKDFPEMLELRPLILNNEVDNMVLGGNQRFKAVVAAGFKEVPCIYASHLTPDQQRQFIIKDNVAAGEWDWVTLKMNWGADALTEWGLPLLPSEAPDLHEFFETGKHERKVDYKITLEYDENEYTSIMNKLEGIEEPMERIFLNAVMNI